MGLTQRRELDMASCVTSVENGVSEPPRIEPFGGQRTWNPENEAKKVFNVGSFETTR